MNIIALKLVTGEDVVGEEPINTDTIKMSYTLKNPVQIAAVPSHTGQLQVMFVPFPKFVSQQDLNREISISATHVVVEYEPDQELINQYNSMFGSGIVVAKNKFV